MFNFSGRASRLEYWLYSLLLIPACAFGLIPIISLAPNRATLGLAIIVILAAVFVLLAVTIRRLHDRNLSGFWVIPFGIAPSILGKLADAAATPGMKIFFGLLGAIFSIWAIVELGFLRGTDGPNDYGDG